MLFAISGSQGSGKSFTLNALKDIGYNIIERKSSRSVLDDWGVTLSEVNNDRELTVRFQDEIIKRKFVDEAIAVASDAVWFTERTYADFFTYCLVSLGKDNEYSDFVDQYFIRCKEYQRTIRGTFFLQAGHFAVEHDGVRGSNKYYSTMVDMVMKEFTEQMSLLPLVHITVADIDDRIKIITDCV